VSSAYILVIENKRVAARSFAAAPMRFGDFARPVPAKECESKHSDDHLMRWGEEFAPYLFPMSSPAVKTLGFIEWSSIRTARNRRAGSSLDYSALRTSKGEV
jgi:hypothetical protein